MRQTRLDLQTIEQSLRDVQREFPKINAILRMLRSRRDSMTDEVLDNMMAGYVLADWAIADEIDRLCRKFSAKVSGGLLTC
jgi:hypothetical protein